MGLISDGGVHSHINHLLALLDMCKQNEIKKLYLHLFTDGRDTSPTSAYSYILPIEEKLNEIKIGKIATISGRYYAMDRDTNYERTKVYYDLITKGIGIEAKNATNGILALYKKNITDEFLYPIILNKDALIKDGDIVLWMNYRSDRGKQIIKSLTSKNFPDFPTYEFNNLAVYSFFNVDKGIKTITFLEDIKINNALGLYLSNLGLTQTRIAETEKYAHVTYFFDGMYSGKIDKCSQVLVESPDVDTYDLKPEMSAAEVTKKAVNAMEKDIDFILVNYANPDMVGHTGNLEATIKAVTMVDICLERLYEVAKDNFYTLIILADHGNADIMIDEYNTPVTTHTTSKVPFIITDTNVELKKSGDLTNVAPTILEYMDIALPPEMQETPTLFS